MIGKVIQGSYFRGLLNYLHAKEGATQISGNMAGETPAQLAAEFRVATALNPRIQKPVCHVSLSLPKQEWLSDETWGAIAKQYITEMGYENCQYVVYRHCDQDHDHIHIALCRIRFTDGKTISDAWEKRRAETVIRHLEHCYQLTPVEPSWQKLDAAPTTGEMRRFERTGELPIRVRLQAQIDQVASQVATISQLIQQLKQHGTEVRLRIANQQITGISYQVAGIAFSGSKLGKAYTFPGLQTYRGLHYDHTTGFETICQAAEFPVARIDADLVTDFERLAERIEHEIQNAPNATERDQAISLAATPDSNQSIAAIDAHQPGDHNNASGISRIEARTQDSGAESTEPASLVPRLQPIVPDSATTADESRGQDGRSLGEIERSRRASSENHPEPFSISPQTVSERGVSHLSRNSGGTDILQPTRSRDGDDFAAPDSDSIDSRSATTIPPKTQYSQPEVNGRSLWQHYNQGIKCQNSAKLGVFVARKALEDQRSLQQVVQMLRHSPMVCEMIQTGKSIDSIKTYINHTVQSAYQKQRNGKSQQSMDL